MSKAWTMTRGLLLLGAAWLGVHLLGIPGRAQNDAKKNDPTPSASDAAALFSGTASCSARGCHGRIEPLSGPDAEKATSLRNEYTLWLLSDPHVKAFSVLSEQRSLDIARRLGMVDARGKPNPFEQARCLACHTNPSAVHAVRGSEAWNERSFGVGCESCHGRATEWLGPHTNVEFWRKLTPAEKEKKGMIDVADPVARFRACAGCHVGSGPDRSHPERDVNHDLIAAGHPRMHFEASAFLANLPAHWNTEAPHHTKRSRAREWAIGQVVAAQESLRLLAHRAQSAKGPWPEFAEYSCYACHHDLKPKNWRQDASLDQARKPGSLPWGGWYLTVPRLLANESDFRAPEVEPALAALRKTMTQSPRPIHAAVAAQASAADAALAGLLNQVRSADWDDAKTAALLKRIASVDVRDVGPDWEHAEQLFLSCLALEESRKSPRKAFAEALLERRVFAPGFESPRDYDPASFFTKLKELAERP